MVGRCQPSTYIYVTNTNDTSRLQHPVHFPQSFTWLSYMFKNIVAKNCVKAAVGEIKLACVAYFKTNIRNVIFIGSHAGSLYLGF